MIVSPIVSTLNTIILLHLVQNFKIRSRLEVPRIGPVAQGTSHRVEAEPWQSLPTLENQHVEGSCTTTKLLLQSAGIVPGISGHWAHDRSPRILARTLLLVPIFLKKMLAATHICTILTHMTSYFHYTRPSLSKNTLPSTAPHPGTPLSFKKPSLSPHPLPTPSVPQGAFPRVPVARFCLITITGSTSY